MNNTIKVGVNLYPIVTIFDNPLSAPCFAEIEYSEDSFHNGSGTIKNFRTFDGEIHMFGGWFLKKGAQFSWRWNESSISVHMLYYHESDGDFTEIIESRNKKIGSDAGRITAKEMAMSLARNCFELAKVFEKRWPTPKDYYKYKASE